MSAQLLSSKVVIIEEEPSVRGIPTAPTSVTGAIGITERGPIGEATLCSSLEEYQRRFGGFTTDSDLALAAMGFFENGGSQLWVVRTVHHTDVNDPATQTAVRASAFLTSPGAPTPAMVEGAAPGPFLLVSGDKLVVSIDGGPDDELVFTATSAAVGSAAGPYALNDGDTLTLRIDGGTEQTVSFAAADFADIANATASEVAAIINSSITGGRASDVGPVVIESDTLGTSSQVEVTGGTGNAVLTFAGGVNTGGGNVANITAVQLAEIETLTEAAIPALDLSAGVGDVLVIETVDTGLGATVQVKPATAGAFMLDGDLHTGSDSGAANCLRVDGKDPGAYANAITVQVSAPTNGDANAFDLAVIEDGTIRESFPNLTMDPDASSYAENAVNHERLGSSTIHLTDQLLPGAPAPAVQTSALGGGDDGLTDLDDNDFIGSEAGKTGLHALDQIQDLTLIIIPGRATSAVHNAMISYCEGQQEGAVFAVLDPPADQSATDIVDYVTTTAALENLSEFAAIYWPRLKVLNPAKSVFGSAEQLVVPPSGILCGVYSRTDSARPGGIYDPPAGIDKGRMFGVLGFETAEVLEERKRDLVYPRRINPLTTGPGLPRFIDGSRTLLGNSNFPYIAERRGVIFIERSLKQGLQFARHKNNTEGLRAQVRRTITAFLLAQMNNGAFRSREPSKAFFVDVSDALNTPSAIFAGKLIVRVGLATNKPAEFIILRISQDTRALEAELAAAGA
jgi:uncharacterized protein